jgi:hypothetical protein
LEPLMLRQHSSSSMNAALAPITLLQQPAMAAIAVAYLRQIATMPQGLMVLDLLCHSHAMMARCHRNSVTVSLKLISTEFHTV